MLTTLIIIFVKRNEDKTVYYNIINSRFHPKKCFYQREILILIYVLTNNHGMAMVKQWRTLQHYPIIELVKQNKFSNHE